MTLSYIFFAAVAGVFVVVIFGYIAVAYAIMGSETQSLDEGQRVRCREAVKSGNSRSVLCKLYIKEGRCPHRPCSIIGE